MQLETVEFHRLGSLRRGSRARQPLAAGADEMLQPWEWWDACLVLSWLPGEPDGTHGVLPMSLPPGCWRGSYSGSPCGLFSKSCWEHWLLAGLAGTWCSSCCRQLTEGTSHLLGKGLSLGWSSAAVQPSGSGFLQH